MAFQIVNMLYQDVQMKLHVTDNEDANVDDESCYNNDLGCEL